MADDRPLLFPELPLMRALTQAERLLLHALPDHEEEHRFAFVELEDEPTCRKLLKRGLVTVLPGTRSSPRSRTKMQAARLPAARPLLRDR